MIIGGFQKFSLIDYPGMICANIFTQGCNFRCVYCHNPELVDPSKYLPCLPEDDLIAFLDKRRGKLDAVTITGGEPTLQNDLLSFVKRVKALGYFIKIDTNGSCPDVISRLVNNRLIDYIAMDIKGPTDKYKAVTLVPVDTEKIKQSIKIIMASNILYEFRTTIVKSLLEPDDIFEIGMLIKNARRYYLQRYIPSEKNNQKLIPVEKYDDDELEAIKIKLQKDILRVEIR